MPMFNGDTYARLLLHTVRSADSTAKAVRRLVSNGSLLVHYVLMVHRAGVEAQGGQEGLKVGGAGVGGIGFGWQMGNLRN